MFVFEHSMEDGVDLVDELIVVFHVHSQDETPVLVDVFWKIL